MGTKQSYAEYLRGWKHLLGQVADDANLSTSAASQRQATLATVVARIEELTKLQSDRDAAKQAASEEIRQLINQGRELSRDIRLEVRGRLGARAIELVRYKVSPLRAGRRSKKAAPEVAPQGAANGGSTSGATPAAGPTANGALSPSKA